MVEKCYVMQFTRRKWWRHHGMQSEVNLWCKQLQSVSAIWINFRFHFLLKSLTKLSIISNRVRWSGKSWRGHRHGVKSVSTELWFQSRKMSLFGDLINRTWFKRVINIWLFLKEFTSGSVDMIKKWFKFFKTRAGFTELDLFISQSENERENKIKNHRRNSTWRVRESSLGRRWLYYLLQS